MVRKILSFLPAALTYLLISILLSVAVVGNVVAVNDKLLVFVSVKEDCKGCCDPLLRLQQAANVHNITLTILRDNSLQNYKILHQALAPHKNASQQVVLYLASPEHALIIEDSQTIVTKFNKTGLRVLFPGDTKCEPDQSLSHYFIPRHKNGFLSSVGICGYADTLFNLTKGDNDLEDQLHYTLEYIANSKGAKSFGIDYYSDVFYTLKETNTLEVTFNNETNKYEALHTVRKKQPSILLSKGANSVNVNRFNDYLNGGRNATACLRCSQTHNTTTPNVTIAVYSFTKTTFLVNFLQKLADQKYPKKNLRIFMYNCIPEHNEAFIVFKNTFQDDYRELHYFYTAYTCDKEKLFERGVAAVKNSHDEFLFVLETFAHLDNANTLKLLLATRNERKVVAPMLKRPDESWTNFWGTIDTEQGFYERSFDYLKISSNEERGIYCVPFVMNAYLVHASAFNYVNYQFAGTWYGLGLEFMTQPDMVFCNNLRKNVSFYGFLYIGDRKKAKSDFMTPLLPEKCIFDPKE